MWLPNKSPHQKMPTSLTDAYRYCGERVRNHYENFPVASLLLPKRLRQPISVIYAFARTADDFADEGALSDLQRLDALADYRNKLNACARGESIDDPVFVALADVIQQWQLPVVLLADLITAFEMDVTKKHFSSHAEVLDYCRYSANPVGRLLLHLFGEATEENLRDSDRICSALQIINFLQDMEQDYVESGRVYLPQDEMARFGVSDQHIANRINDDKMQAFIQSEIKYTRELMLAGVPLGKRLKGRAGLEIRTISQGGLRVLDKLEAQQGDVFSRPRLTIVDWFIMMTKALLPI